MAFADVVTRVADRYGGPPTDPRLVWRGKARPEQLPPPEPWHVWYVQGGRGGGKTWSGAGAMAEWLLDDTDGEGEYGIIAPTYADAWTKCIEGESGLLRALGTNMAQIKDHRSKTVRSAWRTYGQVILHNGITVYADSAAEGGLRIQGRNLKGAWCDEIGLWLNWEIAWNESIRYAVRMGHSKIICTATPKASRPARKLVRSLIRNDPEHGGVVVTKLRTVDNAANLSDNFLRAVIGAAQGTRLERQELEGELLDDVANALWTRDLLDSIRVPGAGLPGGPAAFREIKIGVDPSDGNETSDEQAYTVVGLGMPEDPHPLYVIENWGGQEAPVAFAKRVIRRGEQLAGQFSGTPVEIIIEKNHGGEWLRATFAQVMRQMKVTCRYRVIHASQAKRVRAEPVSALYEQYGGLVRHCHAVTTSKDGHKVPDQNMPELEDQMATFTGAAGERSPDRLDSLVWAASPFLKRDFGPPGRHGVRRHAAQAELDEMGMTRDALVQRRLTGVHDDAYAGSDSWDLDSFAPAKEDQDAQTTGGPRGNIKSWR
jgi:phage terminase large subunit-like protein